MNKSAFERWLDDNFEYVNPNKSNQGRQLMENAFQGGIEEAAKEYKADAMRYRLLRDIGCDTWRPLQNTGCGLSADDCDALIDKEMEKKC